MRTAARRALKDFLARTRLGRFLFYRQSTTFRPAQLAFLLQCVDEVHDVEGTFVEIGCYEGATTIWLNAHLRDVGRQPRYVAIDTFAGFVRSDVEHEVSSRGRAQHEALYGHAFADNKREWVQQTLALNGVTGVELHEADANTYDYAALGRVAFSLVDVDLYVPVLHALRQLWPQLAPGALVVVDDCDASVREWDGALQAYREFCAEAGVPEDIRHRKLGLVRKPR